MYMPIDETTKKATEKLLADLEREFGKDSEEYKNHAAVKILENIRKQEERNRIEMEKSMKQRTGKISKTLPAGVYYIGDPCYVIDDDEWNDFLDIFWDVEDKIYEPDFIYKDRLLFCHGTRHGDGFFPVCNMPFSGSTWLDVDAGMLACLPIALVASDQISDLHYTPDNGKGKLIMAFDKEFECGYDDGVFTFETMTVNTN